MQVEDISCDRELVCRASRRPVRLQNHDSMSRLPVDCTCSTPLSLLMAILIICDILASGGGVAFRLELNSNTDAPS